MNRIECLKALGRAHTYNLRRNPWLRAGLLLGMLATILPLAGEERLARPFTLFFLLYPVVFGLIFGAMGTIRRNLDLQHDRDRTALSGLAMTDPLTGLYNRRFVEEELKNLLHRAERTGEPVSVVFFDLDHFKEVNQKKGHRGGDLTLKMVAEALQSVLRQGEILGRYGGDEFLLVVAADLPYAANLVDRAVAAVRLWTRLSLSAGIARSRDDGTTPEELIALADARLAKAQAKHHAEQGLSLSSEVQAPSSAESRVSPV
jgi:diguanylate cyclase (GGDEF)-like protein